jgi:hypothetical protein
MINFKEAVAFKQTSDPRIMKIFIFVLTPGTRYTFFRFCALCIEARKTTSWVIDVTLIMQSSLIIFHVPGINLTYFVC